MTSRIGTTLCFVAAVCVAMAAQTEPVLTAVNIPSYPALARKARVQGIVKVTFTLSAHAGEPTNVEVVSGHPLLKTSALENVKTWRFENHDAVEHRYETTFEYRFLTGKNVVSFQSFHAVSIEAVDDEDPVIAN